MTNMTSYPAFLWGHLRGMTHFSFDRMENRNVWNQIHPFSHNFLSPIHPARHRVRSLIKLSNIQSAKQSINQPICQSTKKTTQKNTSSNQKKKHQIFLPNHETSGNNQVNKNTTNQLSQSKNQPTINQQKYHLSSFTCC